MKLEITQFDTAKATNDEAILANLLSEMLIHARKEKVSVKEILNGNIAFPEKRVVNVARRSGQPINEAFIGKLEMLAEKIAQVFGVQTSKK
jgi:hypothetical protein